MVDTKDMKDMKDISPGGLYAVGAAAAMLGCYPSYVRVLIKSGDLDARRAGGTGHFRVTGDSMLRYIGGNVKAAGTEGDS